MIDIKTPEEIEIMGQGGKILASVLSELLKNIKPGTTELDIDRLAEKLILKNGATPGFKKVKGYRHSICVSTNNVVVHGVPTNYKFREGDVVGVDCGVFYKGLHTDMAETLRVSTINKQPRLNRGQQLTNNKKDEIDRFLETGKRALRQAIKEAKAGNRVGHISKSIQNIVEEKGYSIVRSLVGHGVGKTLHEEPEIPGFLSEKIEKTPLLKKGTTIAIEVIYNIGRSGVKYLNEDGWTIATEDKSISGLFERTIAITKEGPVILTQ